MGRLLLLIMAAIAVVTVTLAAGRALEAGRHSLQEAGLPSTVQKISYILLIVLMFGVVTGRLGGL